MKQKRKGESNAEECFVREEDPRNKLDEQPGGEDRAGLKPGKGRVERKLF